MKTSLWRMRVATAVGFGAVLLGTTAYASVSETIAAGTVAFSEKIGGPATMTVRRLTIAPGEVLGWHYHAGVGAYTVVKRGTLTLEDGCGGETVFTAGQAFVEGPGHIHRGKNLGAEEVETVQMFIAPVGVPISLPTAGLCIEIVSGAQDISVGTDNRARLLFTHSDNRAFFRSFDSSGSSIIGGPYGPFSGWYARAVADGSDGLTRVLWNNLDGSTGLQLLGPTGSQVSSYRYGAVVGWTAVDVSVGRDNTTQVLWTNTDGRIGLWSLNPSGAVIRSATFGPYSGWFARSISDGADGLARVLWTKTDGSVGLSLIGSAGIVATHRFAPASGWSARDIAVASDNQARILFVNDDGRMVLWTVDNSGVVTNSETVYRPPVSGQAATRISAGADGLTRVLWTSPDGTGTLWLMGLDNVRQSSFGFGAGIE